jgi:uncharacterized phiE125 gp8 family phage protein
MKMLVHRVPADSAEPFVLDDVKDHVRVQDGTEDAAIRRMAWTAAQEIEQFAQIALLTQTIRVTIFDPSPLEYHLRLPIGPVDDDATPTVTVDGAAFTDFAFVGGMRPYIRWLASYHELTPDRINIEYTAGFGATASAIPPDLAQAITDQAALHYDGRSPMDARSLTTSPHMARIGARYRGVQV